MDHENCNCNNVSVEEQHPLAGRSDGYQIEKMHEIIESTECIKRIIDAIPFAVMILNHHRQIVSVNQEIITLLNIHPEQVLGKRPGELIGCIHSSGGVDGCGTSAYCKVCGAVSAITRCQQICERQTEECRITRADGQSLDWEVTVSPFSVQNESFLLVAVSDISDHKRRDALERIFFHDIINYIGAIIGFARMMADENSENPELREVINLANELLDEVQSQRHLAMAERGDLQVQEGAVEMQSFLQRLTQLYKNHPVAGKRKLKLHIPVDIEIQTDARLLKRIIGNMIKNALEASSSGQSVTVFCTREGDAVSVGVHNPAVIATDVQLQIFKRSFSTKRGTGRGLGTYSMKLLGERYLGGKVTFTSDSEKGTTFMLKLPA